MTDLPKLQRLSAAERTQLFYANAHAEFGDHLWRAALDDADPVSSEADTLLRKISLPLAAAFDDPPPSTSIVQQSPAITAAPIRPADGDLSFPGTFSFRPAALGPNHVHAQAIEAAAARTGLPAAALAATIDAEAGKIQSGAWNALSRNPRSSAAGLGQFLGRTWEGEAQRPGTFLHAIAVGRDWLDHGGHVIPAARSALLALRYEPRVAIEAIADYARTNLDRLKAAGIRVEHGAEAVARAAYLAHHLGPGDVVHFLRGEIGGGRAAHLLAAQVGESEAARRIDFAGGDAVEAHRAWLLAFVDRRIRPERFA
jgi:hypothetical protein